MRTGRSKLRRGIALAALAALVSLSPRAPGAAANAGENAAGRSRLSKAQAKTVEQLRGELADKPRFSCATKGSRAGTAVLVDLALRDLEPALVGRNVVFGARWLDFVGPGKKPISAAKFIAWRDRVDQVFDGFADLTGSPPANGGKVYVEVCNAKSLQPLLNGKFPAAHAHAEANILCFNADVLYDSLDDIGRGSWDKTMMHELAHLFANGREWEAEPETIAELFVCHALETQGARFFRRDPPRSFSSAQYRKEKIDVAREAHKRGWLTPFGLQDYDGKTAYDFYLMGLVDKVGWPVYKKALRSYLPDDATYKPKFAFAGDPQVVRAREFLERLAFFHGAPAVLRSLHDKGELLDKSFPVVATPVAPPAKGRGR